MFDTLYMTSRKWKLISHPDTTNPFVASFVNYRCTCRLYPITVGSQTFFDWEGEQSTLHFDSCMIVMTDFKQGLCSLCEYQGSSVTCVHVAVQASSIRTHSMWRGCRPHGSAGTSLHSRHCRCVCEGLSLASAPSVYAGIHSSSYAGGCQPPVPGLAELGMGQDVTAKICLFCSHVLLAEPCQ